MKDPWLDEVPTGPEIQSTAPTVDMKCVPATDDVGFELTARVLSVATNDGPVLTFRTATIHGDPAGDVRLMDAEPHQGSEDSAFRLVQTGPWSLDADTLDVTVTLIRTARTGTRTTVLGTATASGHITAWYDPSRGRLFLGGPEPANRGTVRGPEVVWSDGIYDGRSGIKLRVNGVLDLTFGRLPWDIHPDAQG